MPLSPTQAFWRTCLKVACLCIPALIVAGCSTVQAINALVPESGFTRQADLSYGPSPRQSVDVYVPTRPPSSALRPVVVFFYGGNWDSGRKQDYLFVAEALTSRGYVVVLADYRIYPEVRYPGFMDDGAAAVRWTLDHLADFGGDPSRVHLMGHSAGAYIAVDLVMDDRWLGPRRGAIRSVVGLAGPYDFLPLTDPTLKIIFGTATDLRTTQPITHVDGKSPPLLLMSGLKDTTVRPGNSERLAARVREHGGQAFEHYYPGLSHVTLIGALARPTRFLGPVLDDVARFLDSGEPPAGGNIP